MGERKYLFGQIMPFLLVIIAIFLGAYITAVKVGTVAMNMTCTDNAADACALAAASNMALSLNSIHKEQATNQKAAFDMFQANLKDPSKFIDRDLTAAQTALSQALTAIQGSSNSAYAAAGSPNCSTWGSAQQASSYLQDAIQLLRKAVPKISAASNGFSVMQGVIEGYQSETQEWVCDTIDRKINKLYDQAKRDGVRYALENNCIYPALSSSQQSQIQDRVNEGSYHQLFPDNPDLPPSLGPPVSTTGMDPNLNVSYNWSDSQGNNRNMSSGAILPKIASIEVEVTQRSKPCPIKNAGPYSAGDDYGVISAQMLAIRLAMIAGELQSYVDEEHSIYEGSISAQSCWDPLGIRICCVWEYPGLRNRASAVAERINTYKNELNDIVNTWQVVQKLKQQNKNILKWFGGQGNKVISARSCVDTGDLIVISIKDIKFESGCITCNANIGDSPSSSTASFGGGSLSSASSSNYTPNLTNGCPGNGGVTTGTTTNFTHADSPCP